MKLTLNIWRQAGPNASGQFQKFHRDAVSKDASFLEALDEINEELIQKGEEPIAFDHDCREGICGMCGMVINGMPHGPRTLTTTCQLHMREFKDGAEVWVEPWRATAFPVIKDLAVDRSAFDQIIQAGGYISINTGSPGDANEIPIPKAVADLSMDAATCIGCGACVAACPNASAMLFTSAKATHLGVLPQGQAERLSRARAMVETMETAGFGGCTNHGECEAACPKGISVDYIARLNRDYLKAVVVSQTT
ncbi:MAG: succinate dehydrogenase/fumarate reductase iron-sulfur subunit [Myxococcales bacterium]|nr:succinate dehydrogenase/fumarate reductase iron-sulfur subunit [Myxococcales bacterium]